MKKLIAFVGLSCLLGADFPIYENEFSCWEAYNHIVDCCDLHNDPPPLHCYQGRSCDKTKPDLDQATSDCVRARSCDELAAQGFCGAPYPTVCR